MTRRFKPVILLTGCSSGIGLALTKILINQVQYRVVATVREKSLQQFQEQFPESDRFWPTVLDVTNSQQRQELLEKIEKKWLGVDILVNNAGISYRSVVEHMSQEDEFYQLNTNYLAPMALIRAVIPRMRELGRGKIINISSVSGMLAMPTMSSYSASKHALEGASEALWYEMRPLGIDVTLVQPGFIHSDSFTHVYYSKKSKAAESTGGPYGDYYRNMTPFVEKMMNRSKTSPDQVAKKILWIIKKQNPPLRIPATLDALFFYYIRRWLPRRLFHPFLFWCLPNAKRWGETYTNARPPQKWFR